jgi:Tol biopolymer transport system component
MALTPGARRGPYEITARIGAGGMGEVYRARDTLLDRDVALKILPDAFANDPDRLARFEREARMLAALNHPHIAHIHGVQETDAGPALVLEFVDGPTLDERIAQGPIPIHESLAIASQIADALAAAHDQGIVHRDLKPANIKVRGDGTVKVLDFGLAKPLAPDADGSPTITAPALVTGAGMVVGTAAYMSPEQARGQPIDRRTDIWAFGCVLFEMLGGRAAFRRPTVTETAAAVLERSPDWAALPETTPPFVRQVLARCLEKDPQRRWRDIGDVRLALADAPADPQPIERAPATRLRAAERAAWLLLAALAAAAAALTATLVGRPAAPPEIRFSILYPRDVSADFAQLALSPDGRQLVVAPNFGLQPTAMWLRPLASTAGTMLIGTEGAGFPFWSPDGRSIGFFADQKLKRFDVDSRTIQILGDAPVPRGGAWQADGTILFAPSASGPLFRIAASGGEPVKATELSKGQNDHRAPFILPDGQHFLFYARGEPQVRGVHVARVDGTDVRRLLDADGAAVYSPSGHLLFPRQGELLAQPFDASRLTLAGEAFRVADFISVNPGISLASLAASPAGPIAYGTERVRHTQFTWFDRAGRRLATLGTADQRTLANPALSHDGRRLAFSRVVGGNWDIWLLDMDGSASRLTSALSLDSNAVWASDDRQLFYQGASSTIYSRAMTDGTPEQVIVRERTMIYPSDVSFDGRVLLYTRATGLSTDLYYLALQGTPTPQAFVQTPAQERDGQFSPDGKWVAYQSNETGHFEIYLRPFPGPGDRIQVSTGGGHQVRWSRTSGELFYISGDQRLTSVRVTAAAAGPPVLGPPVPLFPVEFDGGFLSRQPYVVSADGQRFLVNAATDAVEPQAITMILNWRP